MSDDLTLVEEKGVTAVSQSRVRAHLVDLQSDLPTVAGHVLTPNEWLAFEVYGDTGDLKAAGKAAGVTKWTIWSWRMLPWWRELHRQFIQHHQDKFHQQMAIKSQDLLDGLMEIAEGTDKGDKTASARVQAARLFMEAGADPIINRRPDIRIQHNTINNQGVLNIDKVRELSREQILEIVSGSAPPPEEVLE